MKMINKKINIDNLTEKELLEYNKLLEAHRLFEIKNDRNLFTEYVLRDRISKKKVEQSKIHKAMQYAFEHYKKVLVIVPRNSGKCFVAGSMVSLLSGQFKPVEEFVGGEKIVSFNKDNYKFESDTVIGLIDNGMQEVFRVRTKTGYENIVTKNHPFFTIDKYTELREISIGDKILVSDNNFCVENDIIWDNVVSIESVGLQQTYGIEVKNNHSHIVDGIVSHNTSQSLAAMLYEIGQNNNIVIKIVSDGDNTASKRVNAIKQHLEHNMDFRELYPEIKPLTLGNMSLARENWGKTSLTIEREIIDLNSTCLAGDSLVNMPCNREESPNGIKIKDLVDKKDFPVYCYDIEKKIVAVGNCSGVWKVGKKKVYKVTYNWVTYSGKKSNSVIVTEDHKFLLRDCKTYKQTNELKIKDSLMPFSLSYGGLNTERPVIAMGDGREALEHRLVCGVVDDKSVVVHHIDGNKLNNTKDNLIVMTNKEHSRMHSTGRKHSLEARKKMSEIKKAKFKMPYNYYIYLKKYYQNKYGTSDAKLQKTFFKRFPDSQFPPTNQTENHKIKSIEYVGIEYVGIETVYDLSVDKYENVAVNGIIVHNCSASSITTQGVGDRADLLVFDDPCNLRNSILMPALREQVIDAYYSVWLPLLNESGRIWYFGTPYSSDDLTSLLREKWKEEPDCCILDFHLGQEIEITSEGKVVSVSETADDTQSIWPENFSNEFYRSAKRTMTKKAYARAYLCKAVSDSDIFFKMADVQSCLDYSFSLLENIDELEPAD